MHLAVSEVSSVNRSINKVHFSISLFFPVDKLPFINFAISIRFDSFAIRSVIPPLSFVKAAVYASELSIAVCHVALQITRVSPKFRDYYGSYPRLYFPARFKIRVIQADNLIGFLGRRAEAL